MKELIERVACIISAIILFWMVASYVEILVRNTEPNPTYSEANVIVKLIKEVN